ncbi:MAG: LacI family DNA-binding transcriptional regulator [Anaerolineae bacterium]|nr:LacI family DNA-binding transcriptional regulator [Anaerolineae bacterium]
MMEALPQARAKDRLGFAMANPTIYDVAKMAGVGVGTVSRILNNSTRVSPETQEKVLDAIRVLGFRRSKVARQLSTGIQHRNIGAIMPFITPPSFVERLRGMQKALNEQDNDFNFILYDVSEPDRQHEQLLTIVEQSAVDGLLITTLNFTDEERDLLKQAGIPFVLLSDVCTGDTNCISPDNFHGGYLATQHLLSLGHQRIAYLGDEFPNNYGIPTSELRYKGYLSALDDHDISFNSDYVCLGQHGEEIAYQLTQQLLSLPEPPTAIFAMSDIQAVGCILAIRESGLRVPEDISVIGFDDVQLSRYIGLTTVRQHLEQGGYLGMQILMDMIMTPEQVTPRQLPPLELIVRGTTRQRSSV